jgi:hypothetical protein
VRKEYPQLDVSRFESGLISATEAGRWKLVQQLGGPAALYDLQADPRELRDVSGENPEVAQRLREGLGRLLRSVRPIGQPTEGADRDAEHQKMLQALGY